MILITGATGNIGRFLVAELIQRKAPIRLLVRDPSKAAAWAGRAGIVIGDLAVTETLVPALTGVTSVFLLAGPSGDAIAQTKNVIEAARLAGSHPHIVVLSSLGADDPSLALAKVHADRETLVQASGLPWTMLRPGMFMTNTFAWAGTIKTQKTVFNPYAQGSISPIASSDIARVAAAVLTDASYQGRILALTGPEALTNPEQVAALSRVLGYPIACQDISIEQSVEGMIKNGFPGFVAHMLGDLNQRVRNTAKAPVFDTVQTITGRPATKFEDWARENKVVWS
jgi:uncharacterized protein YbjT (DUF2867 family)